MENASEPEAPRMSIQTKRSYKIHQRYHTPWKKSLKIHPKIPTQFDNKASQNTLPSLPEKPARQACAACHRTLQEGSLEAIPRRSPGDRQHTPGGRPFSQKKLNQPHPAASSAQPIQLQTHSPSTQASSFPVKCRLKK